MPDTDAIANEVVWVFYAVGVITLGWVIAQYLRHAESDQSAGWR